MDDRIRALLMEESMWKTLYKVSQLGLIEVSHRVHSMVDEMVANLGRQLTLRVKCLESAPSRAVKSEFRHELTRLEGKFKDLRSDHETIRALEAFKEWMGNR